jgi:hypothetical protein
LKKSDFIDTVVDNYTIIRLERAYDQWCRDFGRHFLKQGNVPPIYEGEAGEETLSEAFLNFVGGYLYAEPRNGGREYFYHLDRAANRTIGLDVG